MYVGCHAKCFKNTIKDIKWADLEKHNSILNLGYDLEFIKNVSYSSPMFLGLIYVLHLRPFVIHPIHHEV